MIHTHFYPDPKTGYLIWFTLGKCEHCGGPVQEANTVNVAWEDRDHLLQLGCKEVPVLPPETYWDDDLGYTACDDCMGKPISFTSKLKDMIADARRQGMAVVIYHPEEFAGLMEAADLEQVMVLAANNHIADTAQAKADVFRRDAPAGDKP